MGPLFPPPPGEAQALLSDKCSYLKIDIAKKKLILPK